MTNNESSKTNCTTDNPSNCESTQNILDGMLKLAAILCICSPLFLVGGCLLSNYAPKASVVTEPTIYVDAMSSMTVLIFAISAFTLVCIAIKDIKTSTIPNNVIYPHILCSICFMLACYFCFSGLSLDSTISALIQMCYGLVFSILLFGIALGLSYFLRRRRVANAKIDDKFDGKEVKSIKGISSKSGVCKNPLIGGGDLKLVGSLSLQLGRDIVPTTAIACVIGIIWSGIFRKQNFPFGPCLAFPAIALALIRLIASL